MLWNRRAQITVQYVFGRFEAEARHLTILLPFARPQTENKDYFFKATDQNGRRILNDFQDSRREIDSNYVCNTGTTVFRRHFYAVDAFGFNKIYAKTGKRKGWEKDGVWRNGMRVENFTREESGSGIENF